MSAGSVIVGRRDGAVALDEVTGATRADEPKPLTHGSVFYVGSIAKQFTAASIALLERDGRLALEDPVARYVPRLPAWGERVTIRHLVHHTAGVKERTRSGPGVPPDGVPGWGNPDLLDRLCAVTDLDFEPGTRYGYSNRGYLLLAEVVAAASGTPLRGFAHERIFEPLGMADTFFRDAPTELPDAAARGHFRAADGQIHVEPARFHAVGAGGLWTTVADLSRWDANFDHDELPGGWLMERLTQRGSLDDGVPIHYAWGLSVRSHRGLPIVSHGGNFPGWESKMVRFPTERTTIIALANGEEFGVSERAFALADSILADRIDHSAPPSDETFEVT